MTQRGQPGAERSENVTSCTATTYKRPITPLAPTFRTSPANGTPPTETQPPPPHAPPRPGKPTQSSPTPPPTQAPRPPPPGPRQAPRPRTRQTPPPGHSAPHPETPQPPPLGAADSPPGRDGPGPRHDRPPLSRRGRTALLGNGGLHSRTQRSPGTRTWPTLYLGTRQFGPPGAASDQPGRGRAEPQARQDPIPALGDPPSRTQGPTPWAWHTRPRTQRPATPGHSGLPSLGATAPAQDIAPHPWAWHAHPRTQRPAAAGHSNPAPRCSWAVLWARRTSLAGRRRVVQGAADSWVGT